MKYYSNTYIRQLAEGFKNRKLTEAEWTHHAHIIIAVLYVREYGVKNSLKLLRVHISGLNEALGGMNSESSGYHETLTKFWLITADIFLSGKNFNSVADACNALINSEAGRSDYVLKYYTSELLFSTEARKVWREPDIAGLYEAGINSNLNVN